MSNNKQKASWWIIVAFMVVPLVTSLVSTIHVISFFELSNYPTLSLILAIAFELGALSSLAGLVAMDKLSKTTVWLIFILLTLFQMMGNTYYSYDTTTTKLIANSNLIKNFTELFGFDTYDANDVIFVKRIIAIISGAILPVISLCFLHLLVKYTVSSNQVIETPVIEPKNILLDEFGEELDEDKKGESNEEKFNEFLKNKKKKLVKDSVDFTELLKILYKEGTIQKGEELPVYPDFIKMVDENKYSTSTVKKFLTLLNYLDVTKVSAEQKIALKSYEDAKIALENYLSLDIQ